MVRAALTLCLLLLAGLAPAAQAATGETRIIVARDPGLTRAERSEIRQDAGVRLAAPLPLANTEVVVAGKGEVKQALRALNADPNVRYAEVDRSVHAFATDPYLADQWALQNTGSTFFGVTGTADADMDVLDPALSGADAWSLSLGTGRTVAVVDSGVEATHPDLSGKIATGLDWVDKDADASDANGHGTHVAGTIAAIRDNGIGVAGVAPQSRVLPLRVLDATGHGTTSDVVSAFTLAAGLGVRVVNASLGASTPSQAEQDAIANHPDTLFVVAAGNDGQPAGEYPCAYPAANVLCVGASDQNDQPATFSNYSPVDVDVFAPGVNILSTYTGGGYAWADGTSMAAPQVSAVAALLLARDPALTASDLKTAIMSTVDATAAFTGKDVSGGRVNAAAALASVPADRDGDGTPDATDPCPDRAFATDCAAAADRDGDGVPDATDRCPDEAGTDPSGCIRVHQDADGDGKPDPFDPCPTTPGLPSTGCPAAPSPTPTPTPAPVSPAPQPVPAAPADSDGDGRNDPLDACPHEAASTVDGCPVPLLRSLSVSVAKHRVRIRVRADRAATAAMRIERRACTHKRCRWRIAASAAAANRSGSFAFARKLARGRYRVSVRLSSNAGQGRLARKSFKL